MLDAVRKIIFDEVQKLSDQNANASTGSVSVSNSIVGRSTQGAKQATKLM